MSAVKERILGAVTVMSDIEAEKIWDIITKHFSFDWDSVETVSPDEWDEQKHKSKPFGSLPLL